MEIREKLKIDRAAKHIRQIGLNAAREAGTPIKYTRWSKLGKPHKVAWWAIAIAFLDAP